MHDLCAVNTWQGPKSSFSLLEWEGRMLSQKLPDRCVIFLWQIGNWVGRHIPLLASFRTNLKPWMHKPTNNTPKSADLCNPCPDNPTILSFRQSVDEQLQGSNLTAKGINQALNAACARHFPVVSKLKDVAHHANDAVLRPIKHLWQLWRSFKQVQRGGDNLQCCFQVWRAFQSFKSRRRWWCKRQRIPQSKS